MRRGEVTEFIVHGEERKKKCANVKLCTDTVVIVYLYTSLHLLMWVIFCSNCVKIVTFFILHIYAQTDVIGIMTITERH